MVLDNIATTFLSRLDLLTVMHFDSSDNKILVVVVVNTLPLGSQMFSLDLVIDEPDKSIGLSKYRVKYKMYIYFLTMNDIRNYNLLTHRPR